MESNHQQYLREMNQRYTNQLKQVSNYNELLTSVSSKPILRKRKDRGISQIGSIIENTTKRLEKPINKLILQNMKKIENNDKVSQYSH